MLEMTFDTDLFKRDARKAFAINQKAFVEAVRYTLNELAVQTYRDARKSLPGQFTLRNTWTARSLAFEKVGSTDIVSEMESRIGSREAYMREQEEGVNKTARGKHGVPIPTPFASGEGRSSRRKKKVLKRYYLNRLRVARGIFDAAAVAAANRKQQYLIAVDMTQRRRRKLMYWESKRGRKGLYEVGTRGDWEINMVYDLTDKRIVSRPRHWLSNATARVSPRLRKLYGKALFFNLRKYAK